MYQVPWLYYSSGAGVNISLVLFRLVLRPKAVHDAANRSSRCCMTSSVWDTKIICVKKLCDQCLRLFSRVVEPSQVESPSFSPKSYKSAFLTVLDAYASSRANNIEKNITLLYSVDNWNFVRLLHVKGDPSLHISVQLIEHIHKRW